PHQVAQPVDLEVLWFIVLQGLDDFHIDALYIHITSLLEIRLEYRPDTSTSLGIGYEEHQVLQRCSMSAQQLLDGVDLGATEPLSRFSLQQRLRDVWPLPVLVELIDG